MFLYKAATGLLVPAVLLGIPKIATGAVYLRSCEIEHFIPIYMIVSGTVTIVLALYLLRIYFINEEYFDVLGTLVCCLFYLIWTICGSVWVFPNVVKMSFVDYQLCSQNTTTNCVAKGCNKHFLKYAVAAVSMDWILCVIVLIIIGIGVYDCLKK